MKRSRNEMNLMEKAAEILDLPGEVLAGLPRLTVTGCSRVLVENHKGLLEYSTERVELSGGRAVVRIRGDGLELKNMTSTEMLVTGTLFGIDFEL